MKRFQGRLQMSFYGGGWNYVDIPAGESKDSPKVLVRLVDRKGNVEKFYWLRIRDRRLLLEEKEVRTRTTK